LSNNRSSAHDREKREQFFYFQDLARFDKPSADVKNESRSCVSITLPASS